MRSNWKIYSAVCPVLIVVTVITYWFVLSCEFVSFDDPEYVYKNPRVLAGLSWSGWKYAWNTFDCGNWHPLTWLSLELDGSLWGTNPFGYHATNLAFHTANSLLIFAVLYRMSNGIFASACVAAFFALHPLHVESVAWVSERKDVLSTFFLLLAIAAYIRYASRPSLTGYFVVLVMFGLGLLAKPMLVTLPILLMLLDVWPLNRLQGSSIHPALPGRFPSQPIRRLILEKIPLLTVAFADGMTTIFAQHHARNALQNLTLDARIANLFNAYFWYLQKTFIPTNLFVFYPHPERTLPWWSVGIGMLAVFGICTWVLIRAKTSPHLFAGWFWFVISLLPVIGLLQVGSQAYADRYAYVPHIGLFAMIAWEIDRWVVHSKTGYLLYVLTAFLALAACGILTRSQIRYWKNSKTLWIHALELSPDNGMAHGHLIDIRMIDGDYEQAIGHIEIGLKQNRVSVANAYCNWGRCLNALNRPFEAEQKFRAALHINGDHEVALVELSKLLVKQGRHAESAEIATRQAEQAPNDYTDQINLGLLCVRQGNIKQAAVHFQKAVQLAPQSAAAYNNLASAQLDLHLLQEAKSNFIRAVELNPELAGAHFNIAAILENEKDFAGAKKHFAEALRINPNDTEARQRLDRLSNQ